MKHHVIEVLKKFTRTVRVKAIAQCFVLDVSYINLLNLMLCKSKTFPL